MAAGADFLVEQVHGPFHRLANARTQTGETMRDVLLSGELWGNAPAAGFDTPRVEAHTGPLDDGDTGFEFYAFARPDFRWGPRMSWTPREDGSVWLDDDRAKIRVLVTRVTQEPA